MSDSKWRKAGIVSLSRSKKVLLLAIWELEAKKWLILDVEAVLDVIAGYKLSSDVLEPHN